MDTVGVVRKDSQGIGKTPCRLNGEFVGPESTVLA